MSPSENRVQRFFAQSVNFVCSELGADWGCFYRVDRRGNLFDFSPLGVPYAVREAYVAQGMARIDPLHPVRLGPSGLRVATVADRRLCCTDEARERFTAFNLSFGMRETAAMVFRDEHGVVGGMSLAWLRAQPGRTDATRALQVQSYIESALNLVSLPRQQASSAAIADDRLSRREQEVVDLACRGLTNQQIARELRIGIATVKTHLINIFAKLGIRNRATLVRHALGISANG